MKPITLPRFILERQKEHPGATGEFSILLSQIALAAKIMAYQLLHSGLANILGKTGTVNVQGEEVQKLDVLANEVFLSALSFSGLVCTLVSEEMELAANLPGNSMDGRYVLLIDPLDGSSNIDNNGPVGSIFSIQRRINLNSPPSSTDLLQKGMRQVAAGYILYGPSTVLVYSTGNGVHGFTLDRRIGEFVLSHPDIRIPARGKTYSVNAGRYAYWHGWAQRYFEYVNAKDPSTNRPYSLRYIGALVADVHRTLLDGGIFLYPADTSNPKRPTGKLRLLYEASPMAYLMEQAGGRATTGTERILDIQPNHIHQRVSLILGSLEDVVVAESFAQRGD